MKIRIVAALLLAGAANQLCAWDAQGHQIVNELAMAALPEDFPAFVKTPDNAARISFLAGEPDRWSHSGEISLKHYNWPDHFIDLEGIPDAGLDYATVSSFRYDFVFAYGKARAAHADAFPPIDQSKNTDHTREWPGFLPWTVTEYYGKLKEAFNSLKAYQQGGTPTEIANAEADIVYLMGIMGHFVGDSSQPLHTTKQFNGWVGPNPNGYTRGYTSGPTFHSWIDGGFITKAGIQTRDIAPRVKAVAALKLPARPDGRDPIFVYEFDFLLEQNKLVEPLYRMEKDGKLARGDQPVLPETRAFIEGQLLKGGELLATLWETAWANSAADSFTVGTLQRRAAAAKSTTAP